jgi:hypothetical protein
MAPPLNGSRVIHRDWEAHHAPVSESAMTATIVIRRGGGAVFSETERRTVYADATMIWSGPARVTPAINSMGRHEPIVADQAKAIKNFEVEVPLAAPRILVADFIEVLAATDRDFEGRHLQVNSYPGGSLVWDRNLICQEIQPAGR